MKKGRHEANTKPAAEKKKKSAAKKPKAKKEAPAKKSGAKKAALYVACALVLIIAAGLITGAVVGRSSKIHPNMSLGGIDIGDMSVAEAEAALQSARDNLRYCTVTSPGDGVVGVIPYRVGSLVSASSAQPLTTVSSINEMYVYFSMTEKQLLALTREQGGLNEAMKNMPPVTLVLSDGTTYSETGKVSTISGVIDPQTGAVQMRTTFSNAQHVLRSGGTGSVLMPNNQKGAIVIPQKATYEIQNKKFVYVVDNKNKVQSREIEVLVQNDGQNYVVSSGLKAGERIVVDGVNKLKNGMDIKPITPEQADKNVQQQKQALKDGKMPGQN